jgi:hypothetical protein
MHAQLLEGAELGNTIMRDQRYVTVNALERDDSSYDCYEPLAASGAQAGEDDVQGAAP